MHRFNALLAVVVLVLTFTLLSLSAVTTLDVSRVQTLFVLAIALAVAAIIRYAIEAYGKQA